MKVSSEVDHCPFCGALANPRWDSCISCGQKLTRPELPDREDRFVWFRSDPYPGDDDKADPVDGRRVVEVIRERGGDLSIQGEHIVLRYWANMPDLASINDWVRTNRLGVVHALNNEDSKFDRLEREAIQDEADFDDATQPGDDGGK